MPEEKIMSGHESALHVQMGTVITMTGSRTETSVLRLAQFKYARW